MKESFTTQARVVEVTRQQLTPTDIYYIVFRHKWKIVLIFLGSAALAVAFYLLNPPLYVSEAKILIRYIIEERSISPEASDAQVKSPDTRGENIINSEVEILTSLDLAYEVVDAVGAENILAGLGGGTNRAAAAGAVKNNLMVEVPRRSNILRVQYQHPDPTVVQPVLSALVDTYLKRHVEIHMGVGVLDDFFARQADQLRARLAQTEQELKKLQTEAQIVSLDDTKRAYIGQITKIQDELLAAEAELAGRRSALEAIEKLLALNATANTNAPALVPAVVEEYRAVCAELDTMLKRQADLQLRYTEEHPLLKIVRQQVADIQARKSKLEQENPELLISGLPAPAQAKTEYDLAAEVSRVSALEAKINVLTEQLNRVRAEATRVVEVEPTIIQLQRKRELEEANYRYYTASLEQARVKESLGPGKVTNISVVQAPSPPWRRIKDVLKPMALILVFGLVGGVGLAFVTERFLDQSIKRVADVERHLRIPLCMSIPDTGRDGVLRLLPLFRNGKRKASGDVSPPPSSGSVLQVRSDEVAPWDPQHRLRPYYEGLRDRLITYFEVRNMTHRPKLVAVTSCTHGAGVSTLAAGLAAALSETGDGNVLLVDMNPEHGAAQHFSKGKPACGLADALEPEKRDNAMVQDNLYLVSVQGTNDQKLPRVLPKRFAHLVPKMKASDFDYIIFDMPPVTQTSITPRLAGFMDMVLMVIESEHTGHELVKRATALLHESNANVAAVLNKYREYLPKRLSQEL